jgi:hypothetical protein
MRNTYFYVYSAKSWIYDKIIQGKHNGDLIVEYSPDGVYSNRKDVSVPISSIWIDESNPDATKIIKCYCKINKSPRTENEKEILDLCREILVAKGMNVRSGMSLYVDDNLEVLRYGTDHGEYETYNTDYSRTKIYNSKPIALKSIFTALENETGVSISGLDFVNLNKVDDIVLEEFGFQKIADKIGTGAPMWLGDPNIALHAARNVNNNSSGNSYDYELREKAVNSMLEILETSLTC